MCAVDWRVLRAKAERIVGKLPGTRLQWSNESSSRRGGEKRRTEKVADEIVAAEIEAEAGETGGNEDNRFGYYPLLSESGQLGGKEICKTSTNVQKE